MKRTSRPSFATVVLIACFMGHCWASEDYSLDQMSGETTIGLPLVSSTLSAMATNALINTFNDYAYAHDDAAVFVASDGQNHGVQLERAWQDYLASQPSPRLEQRAFASEVLVWNAAY